MLAIGDAVPQLNDPGRLLIVGVGPTGLGAAYRLQELGFEDYWILEAGNEPGGLASSHVDSKGFTWDIGGHVQFSHYAYYDNVLDRALPGEGQDLPAHSGVFYCPWNARWEEMGGDLKTCREIKASMPKFVWLDRWKECDRYEFAEYAKCLDEFIVAHYHYVDQAGSPICSFATRMT